MITFILLVIYSLVNSYNNPAFSKTVEYMQVYPKLACFG